MSIKTLLPKSILFCFFQLTFIITFAQKPKVNNEFNHQDTLRGSIGTGRMKWNILHYEITVQPDIQSKTIAGKNTISFKDSGVKLMQIDLQQPMLIDSINDHQQSYSFKREGNVYWVNMSNNLSTLNNPQTKSITIFFHGKPKEALRPPWDGGWIWEKDINGNPWISVACQGLGASVWYPCKDTQADEPDSGCKLNIIVPDSLTAIGNGRLKNVKKINNGLSMYSWEVKSPINNYTIVPYIGKYKHFSEIYNGLNGDLNMDYWVLDYNLEKAKHQFKDAPRMIKAFEYWFGPFPFYEDGYKLVEAPFLGMEHQSAIAYGNDFENGYLGTDLSGTGWGLKWDFIIVHESGHEWFANNITTADIADMWVHEGFTNYSEVLFTEFYYGKTAADTYNKGLRDRIGNDNPIIALYGVNKEGSGDMYYKGCNLIHTIRQIINDDEKFRAILIGLNKTFYHSIVTTKDVENYISKESGINFSSIFNEYLRTIKIPVLEYYFSKNNFYYRWTNTVSNFKMPLKYTFGDSKTESWLNATNAWKSIKQKTPFSIATGKFIANDNFYINTMEIKKAVLVN